MLLNSKVILRTDTEPAMVSLKRKVQGIRKMKNLETEIQDVAPDEHQGLQVERWVQTVRNLSKTLVYGVESEAEVKITSESTLYPWAARHAAFLLNRFVVRKGKTPFEVFFDREYKGTLAPWGSVVLAKPLPKVKEKVKLGEKESFCWKGCCKQHELGERRERNCETQNNASVDANVEVLAEATGTPWNYVQDALVGRKPQKRLPSDSGIEMAIGDGPRVVPRRDQGSNEGDDSGYSPSQDPGPDEAGSDPTSDEEQDRNEENGLIKFRKHKQQRRRSKAECSK